MSEHRIEDLVEEGIRTVLASGRPDAEKARLAARLYAFQACYDTSDTYGRLRRELTAIGFNPDDGAELPLLDAIAAVVADAGQVAVHDWMAVLGEGVHYGPLAEAVPKTFQAFVTNPAALAIRRTAQSMEAANVTPSRSAFWLKPWKSYRNDFRRLHADTLERKHILRFLTDLDEPVDVLFEDYEADRLRLAELAQAPLTRLPELLPTLGDVSFIGFEALGAAKRAAWTFRIGERSDDPDATRYYLILIHEHELGNVLVPTLGIQSGVLRRWQGLPFDAEVIHFRRAIGDLLDADVLNADPQFAKGRIGWPYRVDQSESLLIKRLRAMVEFIPAMLASAQPFHDTPLHDFLDGTTAEQVLALRPQLAFEQGFFVNRIEILFAFACRAQERGDGPDPRMLAHIAELIQATHETHPLKVAWAEAHQRLAQGELCFPRLDEVRMAARLMNEVEDWRD